MSLQRFGPSSSPSPPPPSPKTTPGPIATHTGNLADADPSSASTTPAARDSPLEIEGRPRSVITAPSRSSSIHAPAPPMTALGTRSLRSNPHTQANAPVPAASNEPVFSQMFNLDSPAPIKREDGPCTCPFPLQSRGFLWGLHWATTGHLGGAWGGRLGSRVQDAGRRASSANARVRSVSARALRSVGPCTLTVILLARAVHNIACRFGGGGSPVGVLPPKFFDGGATAAPELGTAKVDAGAQSFHPQNVYRTDHQLSSLRTQQSLGGTSAPRRTRSRAVAPSRATTRRTGTSTTSRTRSSSPSPAHGTRSLRPSRRRTRKSRASRP